MQWPRQDVFLGTSSCQVLLTLPTPKPLGLVTAALSAGPERPLLITLSRCSAWEQRPFSVAAEKEEASLLDGKWLSWMAIFGYSTICYFRRSPAEGRVIWLRHVKNHCGDSCLPPSSPQSTETTLSCDVSYKQNKTGIWDQNVPHLAVPIVMRVSWVIILKNPGSLQSPSHLPGWIAHKAVSSQHKTELRKLCAAMSTVWGKLSLNLCTWNTLIKHFHSDTCPVRTGTPGRWFGPVDKDEDGFRYTWVYFPSRCACCVLALEGFPKGKVWWPPTTAV